METSWDATVATKPTRTEAKKEGPIAKAIEEQTAKLPSDTFLWASAGVMSTSLILKLIGKDHLALFIGQWAAPLLLFGIYNKLVKLQGHDQTDDGNNERNIGYGHRTTTAIEQPLIK
jgi:hypothetical protein